MNDFFTFSATALPILVEGVKYTVLVTFCSLILSTLLGLMWALMRLSAHRPLRLVSGAVVNVLRGIPMLVQLFYIYFVLPDIGIEMSALTAAIIGLGIAYSVYLAEDFRAGIQAIDKGQIEAAQTLGMSKRLMMRRFILPQAIKIIWPSYGNTMVMMLKDSSLASTITVAELSLQGKLLASATFQNTTVFTLVALLYLVMCWPLMWLCRRVEHAMNKRRSH